jgi:transcriptional regulator with XRE-family HTH domain
MEVFGERVRRARIAQGWATYRAADKATGISASTWQNIEARGKDPRLSTVQRLLEVLDVPCEELLACPVSDRSDDPEADPATRLAPDPDPDNLGGSAGQAGKTGKRRGSGSKRRSS